MEQRYIISILFKKISKLSVLLLLMSLALLGNHMTLSYAIETYLEVDQITFDENRQIRIVFNQALDTSYALNPDLFSASYNDASGYTNYVNTSVNKVAAQYDGDRTVVLTLNSTVGTQRTFYTSGKVTADILENAVKSSAGELYLGNQWIVKSAIEPYDVAVKIMVGGQEISSDSLILSEDQIGSSSITADVTLTVRDPNTNAVIPGVDLTVKNYQHTVVASATTDANGEVTFSNLVLDGSLKYLISDSIETSVIVVIPTGKAMVHMNLTSRTRVTSTSIYDGNGSKVTLSSPEFLFIGYSDSYSITTTDAKKLVFYADLGLIGDDPWKCTSVIKTLDLESGKIQMIQMDLNNRNLYTRIKKTKDDASTTLSTIKKLYVLDPTTGNSIYDIDANTNVPHPNEVEFWLDNAQLPEEFAISISGEIGGDENIYIYAPDKLFTKTVADSFTMPHSDHLSKIYNVGQPTIEYGDTVFDYLYLRSNPATEVPIDMNLYLLTFYNDYKPLENKTAYRLYETDDDVLLMPYKVVSIIRDKPLSHYFYFEKNWTDSDSLPREASIATPLALKVDKTSVKKEETLTFNFETQSGYKLTTIRNYSTNVKSFPEVTISKDSKTVAVTSTGKWETTLTTAPGTYTATITDASSMALDSSEKIKTFEVLPFKPDAPVIQSAAPGDEKVEVSWLPVSNATGYKIYVSTDTITTTSSAIKVVDATVNQTSASIDGLTNGQTYYFRVSAKSVDLDSELSQTVSSKPMPPLPNAPVLSAPTISDNGVTLSWTAVDKAENYKIYARTETTSSQAIQVVPSTQTTITLQNLDKGKGYTFQIAATNITGEGLNSNEAYLLYVTVPSAPNSVVAQEGNSTVRLEVGKPTDDGGSPLKGYHVTILPTNETRTYSTTSSAIVVDQLSNGVEYSFKVSAFNAVGTGASTVSNKVKPFEDKDDPDEPDQTPSDPAPSVPDQTTQEEDGASVWVDGIEEKIGNQKVLIENDLKQTTISVNEAELKKKLEQKTENPVVTLKDSTSSDVFIGAFNGSTINLLQSYKGTIEMDTNFANYKLPVDAIDWSSYNMDTVRAQIEVKTVSKPLPEQLKAFGITEVIGEPVEFSVHVYQDDKEVEVKRFKKFVGRTIETPDSRQITTAIVYEDDGTYRSVPTEVKLQDGQYVAKINSLTNSQYTLIWNPVTFDDMVNHWAKATVNELGSRLVVSGIGNKKYAPDDTVTRAEYITALVKGLGLPIQTKTVHFTDVSIDKWYNPYIFAADDFGIMDHWASENTLKPNTAITRSEAAQLISNAFQWTTLDPSLTESEIVALLSGYDDYALMPANERKAVALCVKYNIIVGRYNAIAPQDQMTRAEMATMILKFLQVAKLI
ncbi:fibronectin type III domain-containing protein [Fusibacter ferrireducens]|uniref:Fibronectin type III domain-containing protein n=1 Tax=Fusibacter ferrireducens TaxID=2785058 RepID=A0ABR9ZRL5_9FIRM|nr:fibronectin type III domain-containing protein [Fusibacter ferrireducens]MBF4693092.1 fibronectin type III domain-containing protein [Fusibacter ferrireducens]